MVRRVADAAADAQFRKIADAISTIPSQGERVR